MSSPTIVSCLLGIYFLLAGCLQIALFVSSTPRDPFAPFLSGLTAASWPLAVAAVIFILLDIRMQRAIEAQRKRSSSYADEDDEELVPEAPARSRAHRTVEAPQANSVSYFNLEPAAQEQPPAPQPTLPPAPQPAPQSAPPQHGHSQPAFFATPPPFTPQASAAVSPSISPTVFLGGDRAKHSQAQPAGSAASVVITPPAEPAREPATPQAPPPPPNTQQSNLSFFKV